MKPTDFSNHLAHPFESLPAELKKILSLDPLTSGMIAAELRQSQGHRIPVDEGGEHAYVLHWFLNLYFEHGADYMKVAVRITQSSRLN